MVFARSSPSSFLVGWKDVISGGVAIVAIDTSTPIMTHAAIRLRPLVSAVFVNVAGLDV